MDWRGLNTAKSERHVPDVSNGMDVVFSAVNQDCKGSRLGALSATAMQHARNNATEHNNNASVQVKEKLSLASDIENRRHNNATVARSLPEAINGIPMEMYPYSPLFMPLFHPQMNAQTHLAHQLNNVPLSVLPSLTHGGNGAGELKCSACGLNCKTFNELREHILTKHISSTSNSDKTKLRQDIENRERKASLTSTNLLGDGATFQDTSQRNKQKVPALSAQNVLDASSNPGKFPIPTPDFSFLKSFNAALDNKSQAGIPQPTSHTNAVLHPYSDASSGKALLFPQIPGAYSMLNPLLAYQNLINANGLLCPPSPVQSHLTSQMSLAAAGYPFLRYPGLNFNMAGRLPFIPSMNMMIPSSSAPTVTDATLYTGIPAPLIKMGMQAQDESGEPHRETTTPHGLIPSCQMDSYKRRVSMPHIGLNKDFRVPYPYNRAGKLGNGTPCAPVIEENESGVKLENARHKDTQPVPVPNRKRRSVIEKSTSNRLNAKSIEQHISKLISNNEKLLLNPILERVKPRRVFRRNSLDPASLSSYATTITGRNLTDSLYYKDNEVMKKTRKLQSEQSNQSNASTTLKFHSADTAPYKTTSEVSTTEHDKMIQLTRFPNFMKSSSAVNPVDNTDAISVSGKPESISETETFHEKRGLPSDFLAPSSKRSKLGGFKCTDYGIYSSEKERRKDGDYQLQKAMYYSYKTDQKQISTSHLQDTELVKDNVDTFSKSSSSESLMENCISDLSKSPHSTSGIATNNPVVKSSVTTSVKQTLLVPSQHHSDILINPMKHLHNDLCRTRSAEATLQTASARVLKDKGGMNDLRNTKTSIVLSTNNVIPVSAPKLSIPCAAHDLTNTFTVVQTDSGDNTQLDAIATSSGLMSSIPKNKLPPNKRHLKRHFEQGSFVGETGMQLQELKSCNADANVTNCIAVALGKDTSVIPASSIQHVRSGSIEDYSGSIVSEGASSKFLSFDEVSAPRSNYKLLLHQISLRNLQDMEMLNLSNLSRDKSVWSWQQMQNGIRRPEHADKSPHKSLGPASSTITHHQSKFSVPSRVSQLPDIIHQSEGVVDKTINVKRLHSLEKVVSPLQQKRLHSSGFNQDFLKDQSSLTTQINRSECAKMKPLTEQLTNTSLPTFTEGNNQSRRVVETNTLDTAVSVTPDSCEKSSSIFSCTSENGRSDQKYKTPAVTLASSTKSTSGTLFNSVNDQLSHPMSVKTPEISDQDNNSEAGTKQMIRMSAVLYPHMQPTLIALSHVSYCCLVNPQPTCMTIPKSSVSENSQISMYSDWAVSDPILVPTDLTISDLLKGWRLTRAGYRKGIVVMVESQSDMIMTEHKLYEMQKKKRSEKLESVDANDSNTSTTENKDSFESGCESKSTSVSRTCTVGSEDITLPLRIASRLTTSSAKPVYASCHHSRDMHLSRAVGSYTTVASTSCVTAMTNLSSKTDVLTSSNAQSDTSSIEKHHTVTDRDPLVGTAGLSHLMSHTMNEDDVSEDDEIPEKGSSCFSNEVKGKRKLTETDSSSVKTKTVSAGKIKRRKTRRERTAASPREKRRALHCQSPPSPSSPCVLPVHQSNACSSATEENLRGCALCSIKAGRADLITDSTSACQPCIEAAKKSPKPSSSILKLRLPSTSSSKPGFISGSPQYLTPPLSSSGYLDKTRASGNTQHWISDRTPEHIDCTSPQVFLYPPPQSSRSVTADCTSVTALQSGVTSPPINDAAGKSLKDAVSTDVSKLPTSGHQMHDSNSSVLSPSLAEVVSEVVRTAAMQSKRNSQSVKSHQLLSQSRALLPGNLSSSLSAHSTESGLSSKPTEQEGQSNTSELVQCDGRFSFNSRLSASCGDTSLNRINVKSSQKRMVENISIESTKSCEITFTPASPSLPSSPKHTSKESLSGSPSISLSRDNFAKTSGKISQRSSILSSRETELFLNKANTLHSTNITEESGVEACEPHQPHRAADSSENRCTSTMEQTYAATGENENGSAGNDYVPCDSDEEGVKDEPEDSKLFDGTARRHRCHECKVAFRIGGHLAKHLRSKGHTVAMQKKTLNLLKMRQMQLCVGNSGSSAQCTESEEIDVVSLDPQSTTGKLMSSITVSNRRLNKPGAPEVLDGTEGLARAQVRALLEGSGEYACVPNVSCDDILVGDMGEEFGAQDPRPFKCIACKVAFRFQGHLDRHFRSNLHLIAVGQYEQEAAMISSSGAFQTVFSTAADVHGSTNVKESMKKTISSNDAEKESQCDSFSRSTDKLNNQTNVDDNISTIVAGGDDSHCKKVCDDVDQHVKQDITLSNLRVSTSSAVSCSSVCHSLPSNNLPIQSDRKLSATMGDVSGDCVPLEVAHRFTPKYDNSGNASPMHNLLCSDVMKEDPYSDSDVINFTRINTEKQHLERQKQQLPLLRDSASEDHVTDRSADAHRMESAQTDDDAPLRSSDCIARSIMLPCQVSCT